MQAVLNPSCTMLYLCVFREASDFPVQRHSRAVHLLSRSQVGVTHSLYDIIKEISWKTSLQGACVLAGFSFSFPLSSGTNIPCPEPPFGAKKFSIDPKQSMPTSESLGHWNLFADHCRVPSWRCLHQSRSASVPV